MKFTLTTILTLASMASASPTPTKTSSTLAKRGPESLHLVNCQDRATNKRFYSQIRYYKDDATVSPTRTADDVCMPQWTNLYQWEGKAIGCYDRPFESGVKITGGIDGDARSRPAYSVVGGLNNGYRQFTCYNDDRRVIFQDQYDVCYRIYYCL